MGRLRGYGWLWWMVRFVNFHEKISGKKSVTPHWTMAVTINREGRKPCFSSQTLSNFLGAKKCWLSPGKNTVKSWLLIWSICICCSWPTPALDSNKQNLIRSFVQNIQGVVISSALRDGEVHHNKYGHRLIAIGNQRRYSCVIYHVWKG